MRVRIISHSGRRRVPYWYVDRIGEEFKAYGTGQYLHTDIDGRPHVIDRRDVEILEGGEGNAKSSAAH